MSITEQLTSEFVPSDSDFNDLAFGPLSYLSDAGSDTKIGLIFPMSNNCFVTRNRVRLTAEGKLLLCLGNEHSLGLRALVREYHGDMEALQQAAVASIARKPERHYFDPADITVTRQMNATGG